MTPGDIANFPWFSYGGLSPWRCRLNKTCWHWTGKAFGCERIQLRQVLRSKKFEKKKKVYLVVTWYLNFFPNEFLKIFYNIPKTSKFVEYKIFKTEIKIQKIPQRFQNDYYLTHLKIEKIHKCHKVSKFLKFLLKSVGFDGKILKFFWNSFKNFKNSAKWQERPQIFFWIFSITFKNGFWLFYKNF